MDRIDSAYTGVLYIGVSINQMNSRDENEILYWSRYWNYQYQSGFV